MTVVTSASSSASRRRQQKSPSRSTPSLRARALPSVPVPLLHESRDDEVDDEVEDEVEDKEDKVKSPRQNIWHRLRRIELDAKHAKHADMMEKKEKKEEDNEDEGDEDDLLIHKTIRLDKSQPFHDDNCKFKPKIHIKVMQFLLKVALAPNILTGSNKLSRAASFMFVFVTLHAFPNFMLLFEDGKKNYNEYGKKVQGLPLLLPVELFLCLCFLIHIWLAFKVFLKKYALGMKKIGILQVTGTIILSFLISHLIDFRFNNFTKYRLDEMLVHEIGPYLKKAWYFIGICATSLHSYKGISESWLSNLDFNKQEMRYIIPLGRFLVILSTCLYLIPLIVIHSSTNEVNSGDTYKSISRA